MISKLIPCCLLLLLAACAGKPLSMPVGSTSQPAPQVIERRVIVPTPPPAMPELDYYLEVVRLNSSELAHERQQGQALPPTLGNRLRLAMLYSQPRASLQELSKAQSVLQEVLRMPPADDMSKRLLSVARLLSDQVADRLRQEILLERQAQQIREGQRKAAELNEKLERLTDVEKRLGQRARQPVGIAP